MTDALDSMFEKLLPALDSYMLAVLKLKQFHSQHPDIAVPKELYDESQNSLDIITEEWCAIHPDYMNTQKT